MMHVSFGALPGHNTACA